MQDMQYWKKMYSMIIIQLCLVVGIHSKGRVSIQLVEYRNRNGLTADGKCCDGINLPGCPIDSQKCDHHFQICVTDQAAISGCLYGEEEFNANDNENTVVFNNGKSSLFGFDKWQGGVSIRINVSDSDSEGLQAVDYLTLNYNSSVVGYNFSTTVYTTTYTLTGQRPTDPTSLMLKIKVYCDPHYYGDDCSLNCVADDSCKGHYRCNDKGLKVCLPGWRGNDCNEQIPGDVADCTEYKNRSEIVPSMWSGEYQCQSDGPEEFSLNISKSQSSINVVGDLIVASSSVSIHLTGSFSSVLQIFTLQGQNLLTNIELNLRQDSSTVMSGGVKIDQETCPLNFLKRVKAYFDGCNYSGSCVRYASLKNQYYCCCNDGTVSQSCTDTIHERTTGTSSTTSSTGSREQSVNKTAVCHPEGSEKKMANCGPS